MTGRTCPPLLLVVLVPILCAAPARAAGPADQVTLAPTVELRQVGDVLVPFQAGLPVPTYDPQLRPRIDLSEGWRRWAAHLDHALTMSQRAPTILAAIEKEGGGAHRIGYDDRHWEPARLPEVANPWPRPTPSGVWYRRQVSIPAGWKGHRVIFHCLAANYVADLWVNGRYVGYHEGGCTPFSFDITEHVRCGEANTIALRVDNPPWPASEKGSRDPAWPSRALVPPGPADWWNATGVLRDIYLEAVPETWLVRADVSAQPAARGTRVKADIVVRHVGREVFSGRVRVRVHEALVAEANLTSSFAHGLIGNRPPVPVLDGRPEMQVVLTPDTVVVVPVEFRTSPLALWSPGEPNLYVLDVELRDEENLFVDRLVVQFGIRVLAAGPEGLVLNGRPLVLRGVARVEDDAQFGRALTFDDALRILLDLRTAKGIGSNFVHLGHFVNHPLTTLLADRLGVVCWEEIPAFHMDAVALGLQWEHRRVARQMLIEMICQDRNRPSVGIWGVGHALEPGDMARRFVRDLADIAHYLDPSRLVAESRAWEPNAGAQGESDLVGLYFPQIEWAAPDAGTQVAGALARVQPGGEHPRRGPLPLILFHVTVGQEAASAQRQARAAREVVRALAAVPGIAGWAWWALADHQAQAGLAQVGLITRDRSIFRPVAAALAEEYRHLGE